MFDQMNLSQTKSEQVASCDRNSLVLSRFGFRVGRGLSVLMLFLAFALTAESALGQWIEERDLVGPYVDGEPFDLLYLNEQGEDAILKIAPLAKPPKKPLPDRGELIFATLTPDGFQQHSRAQLIAPTRQQLNKRGGVVWAHPAIADGYIYVRSDEELLRASLR